MGKQFQSYISLRPRPYIPEGAQIPREKYCSICIALMRIFPCSEVLSHYLEYRQHCKCYVTSFYTASFREQWQRKLSAHVTYTRLCKNTQVCDVFRHSMNDARHCTPSQMGTYSSFHTPVRASFQQEFDTLFTSIFTGQVQRCLSSSSSVMNVGIICS